MSEDPDYYPLQPLATTAIRQFLAFLYVAATGLALLATAALPLLSPRVAARAEAAVVAALFWLLWVGFTWWLALRRDDLQGWRLNADGLHEVRRLGQARLYRWDELEHVVIEPQGARVLGLRGEALISREVKYFQELVERIQRELWQRHGRSVPRTRDLPAGAISRARGDDPTATRGLSRSE